MDGGESLTSFLPYAFLHKPIMRKALFTDEGVTSYVVIAQDCIGQLVVPLLADGTQGSWRSRNFGRS